MSTILLKLTQTVLIVVLWIACALALVVLQEFALTGASATAASLPPTGHTLIMLSYSLSVLLLGIVVMIGFATMVLSIWVREIKLAACFLVDILGDAIWGVMKRRGEARARGYLDVGEDKLSPNASGTLSEQPAGDIPAKPNE